jgi:CheY-like chemotaxis protein
MEPATILIVEDNTVIRKALESILKKYMVIMSLLPLTVRSSKH